MQNPNGSLKTRLRQARIASTSANVRHPAALPSFFRLPQTRTIAHAPPSPKAA
ncbi:hypothetical protein [Kingella oralis]|uniref:hypothetical protein n=1 Tax=Kingella oralis TaxID=505 RepID=UPI002D801EFD|nr:hypothetical protein [Kingella oralis]